MSRLREILRKHCFLFAIVVLLWRGWSATQAAEPPAVAEGEETTTALPPELGPDDFPERHTNDFLQPALDPFFLQALLQQRRDAEAARLTAMASPVRVVETAPEEEVGVPYLITLQATIPGGALPRACINGQDLAVGDAVTGVDEFAPPVLIGVAGTSVLLDYRGESLRLDLDSGASMMVFVKSQSGAPAIAEKPVPAPE
jgi:hypothetical protein